ncbi:hypothetical protein [Sporosalibacterium faouarense]|uniref:hypothetical protein n=1 Tax=Sporosalibacterium faouarense TaxID=516123 RepID=UPI00192A85DD|nr:hypothetical protein [Sporosalibacterium faouarense]
MTLKEFKEAKCDKLLKYGANKDYLWLTECTTVEDFISMYGRDLAEDLELLEYKYVLYYHESGSVNAIGGFNNQEEFEKACEYVGNYLDAPY